MVVASKGTIAADTLNVDERLDTTGYTIKEVLDMLQEHNPRFREALGGGKVKKISAKDISEGKGYMSRVYRTVVEFHGGEKPAYTCMLKIPTMDLVGKAFEEMMGKEQTEKFQKDFSNLHDLECDALEFLKRVHDFPLVETYLLRKNAGPGRPGLIMMEDGSVRGMSLWINRAVTAGQCLNVARHLGSLHAQMQFMDGWRERFTRNFRFDSEWAGQVPNWLGKLAEAKPKFAEIATRLSSISIEGFSRYALQELPQRYNAMVFCHGDNGSHNMLFRIAEDGSLMDEIAAFLDWQTVHQGSPLHDLARFTTMCADAETRREIEKQAVDLYYDTFCEEYAKHTKEEVPFTREQAHELYDLAYIQQTYETVSFLTAMDKLFGADGASEPVVEARTAKFALRSRLAAEDAFALMEKYGIFERFAKKDE